MAQSYKDQLSKANDENAKQKDDLAKLQAMYKESEAKLLSTANWVPIQVIQKERHGRRGRPSWPMFIWELILEQLVNRTPPTYINDNIVAHVKAFSPSATIKEMPSIWTIRRASTVLLVVVQTLAVYRLSLAGKWGQLFPDDQVEDKSHSRIWSLV